MAPEVTMPHPDPAPPPSPSTAPSIRRAADWRDFARLLRARAAPVIVLHGATDAAHLHRAATLLPGLRRADPLFGQVRDIAAPGTAGAAAGFTPQGDVHTDAVVVPEVPRWVLHQFLQPDPAGGVTRYVAIDAVLADMPACIQQPLLTCAMRYRQRIDGRMRCWQGRLLDHRDGNRTLRWRDNPAIAPEPVVDAPALSMALAWLRRRVGATQEHRLPVSAGDLVVIDNLRVLHGRTVPDPASWPRGRVMWVG
jgi:alpha-ketoglutarate-dependent taurine dioxygenase